jgi:hypothetical protein
MPSLRNLPLPWLWAAPVLAALAACSPRPAPPPAPAPATPPASAASQPQPQAPARLPVPVPAPTPPLSDQERDAVLFTLWRDDHAAQVDAFEQFLVQSQVAGVVPTYQLLRSASMWKECHADPFEVPPATLWPRVRDVLRLVRELQQRGVLPAVEVVSAYRDPRLNRCAGGAPRSAHLKFAIDIAPLTPADGQRLCRFWRDEGQGWDMGVSRYPSGRVHIDRNGYRTWGASHKRASSYCLD